MLNALLQMVFCTVTVPSPQASHTHEERDRMSVATVPNITKKQKPDIRAITRLVPPSGNLVQGQSELPISPVLAQAAAEAIARNKNHYCPAEGIAELRSAVAK